MNMAQIRRRQRAAERERLPVQEQIRLHADGTWRLITGNYHGEVDPNIIDMMVEGMMPVFKLGQQNPSLVIIDQPSQE